MKTMVKTGDRARTVGTALFLLAVGAGLGVAGTHWYEHRTSHRSSAQLIKPLTLTADAQRTAAADTNSLDPFQEMRYVQSQVDKAFQQSFDRLQSSPNVESFFSHAGYSSSLDVRDLKDRVEVHAYLPDAKTADAHVSVQGDELTVEVTKKQAETVTGKNQETQLSEWGRYDQLVQLPGNVQADKMKVIRKDHELIITLPKTS